MNKALALAAIGLASAAAARITAPPGAKIFRLDGAGVTYAIGVDDKGYVEPAYWGAALDPAAPLSVTADAGTSSFDGGGSRPRSRRTDTAQLHRGRSRR